MAIPYNDNLRWQVYTVTPNWHKDQPELVTDYPSQAKRAANEVFIQLPKQSVVRSVQFVRDGLRLVLKVPIRLVRTAFKQQEDSWKQYERANINAKLTGYSWVQMSFVPVKFLVALAALLIVAASSKRAQALLDWSGRWTVHFDGSASQLEALKEEGTNNASTPEEYSQYKQWLCGIDPKLCCKPPVIEG